ncbi:MAG: ATP-binding cassette domain-containing protein [Phycisphaeraceae bacterium]|nr:ATP-binding cassette domain-containing protein [Phycisphaeraceae bacterium]
MIHLRPWLCYQHRRHDPPIPGSPAMELRDLLLAYPGAAAPALRLDHLRLAEGRRMALVGPNGSGKSTLLKAVAGILKPAAGRILVHGLPIGACHQHVSYLAQRDEVNWRFPISVRRLVLTGRYVHLGWLRRPRRGDHLLVEQLLDRLAIRDLADRQIGELSGGQQQRALLARALAQQADLLLLDEPLNAVDVETRKILADVLDELHRAGRTIVIATHDHGRLDEHFDQILFLHEGRQVDADPHLDDHADHHASHPHPAAD